MLMLIVQAVSIVVACLCAVLLIIAALAPLIPASWGKPKPRVIAARRGVPVRVVRIDCSA